MEAAEARDPPRSPAATETPRRLKLHRQSTMKRRMQDSQQSRLFAKKGHTWYLIKRAGEGDLEKLDELHETLKTKSSEPYKTSEDEELVWTCQDRELRTDESPNENRGPAGDLAVHLCYLLPDKRATPTEEYYVFATCKAWREAAAFDFKHREKFECHEMTFEDMRALELQPENVDDEGDGDFSDDFPWSFDEGKLKDFIVSALSIEAERNHEGVKSVAERSCWLFKVHNMPDGTHNMPDMRDRNQTQRVAERFRTQMDKVLLREKVFGENNTSVGEWRTKDESIRGVAKRMLWKCPSRSLPHHPRVGENEKHWDDDDHIDGISSFALREEDLPEPQPEPRDLHTAGLTQLAYVANLINAPYMLKNSDEGGSGSLVVDDKCKYFGETCLHIAIVNQEMSNVRWLVEGGASLCIRATGSFFQQDCVFGEYPMNFAVSYGTIEIVKYLWKKGEELDLNRKSHFYTCMEKESDVEGNNCLHMAVLRAKYDLDGAKEVFGFLHSKLKDEYMPGENGNLVMMTRNIRDRLTPMNLAVHEGLDEMFAFIMECTREVQWSYGPVTAYSVRLDGIDSVRPEFGELESTRTTCLPGLSTRGEFGAEMEKIINNAKALQVRAHGEEDAKDMQTERWINAMTSDHIQSLLEDGGHIPYVNQPIRESCLALASQLGMHKILANPVLEDIINEKWRTFGQKYFLRSFVFYICYLVCFTYLVTERRSAADRGAVSQSPYTGHVLRAWRAWDDSCDDDALALGSNLVWQPDRGEGAGLTSRICVADSGTSVTRVATGAHERATHIWAMEIICLAFAWLKVLFEWKNFVSTWTYQSSELSMRNISESKRAEPTASRAPMRSHTKESPQVLMRSKSMVNRRLSSCATSRNSTVGWPPLAVRFRDVGTRSSDPIRQASRDDKQAVATSSKSTRFIHRFVGGMKRKIKQFNVICGYGWEEFKMFGKRVWLTGDRNALIVVSFCTGFTVQFVYFVLKMDTEANIALAVTVPILYVYILTYYARGSQIASQFVAALDKMIIDCLQFGLLYSLFIVAFAASLYLCYSENCADIADANGVVDGEDTVTCDELEELGLHSRLYTRHFRTLQSSMLYLFRMSIGGADFDAVSKHSGSSPFIVHSIFALYNVTVGIVLVNTLIAMLSASYAYHSERSAQAWLRQKAQLVLSMERSLVSDLPPLARFFFLSFPIHIVFPLPVLSSKDNRIRTTWFDEFDDHGNRREGINHLVEKYVFNVDSAGRRFTEAELHSRRRRKKLQNEFERLKIFSV